MKIINKIILAGLAVLWTACSNDVSDESSFSGATTEPNSSPTAQLTGEQKVILARSLVSMMDPSLADSLKDLFISAYESSGYKVNSLYKEYINPLPWSIKTSRVDSYQSRDGRKVCDVVNFAGENGVERYGVLRATSYDEIDHECYHHNNPGQKCAEGDADEDYLYTHHFETILETKIVDVDGISILVNSIASLRMRDAFWGYDVSCVEAYNQFKQSCEASNGLLWDYGDGCSRNDLEMICTSFLPEGEAWYDVVNSYGQEYHDFCLQDSINYAPYDDQYYVWVNPYTDQTYLDSLNRVANAESEWANTLKRSTNAYRWQFLVADSTVRYIPEINGGVGLAYNTLPNTPIADTYRNEGVYVLPDSLVTTFFPKLADYQATLEEFRRARASKNSIFYLIVLKDVGAKGHSLNYFDEDGLYITDIVKSGNCPEDTTVHYPMILLADSPDWDVLNRPIVKTTYVSDNWNCDKPETLDKIEPYGEWIDSGIYSYNEYVKLFGAD